MVTQMAAMLSISSLEIEKHSQPGLANNVTQSKSPMSNRKFVTRSSKTKENRYIIAQWWWGGAWVTFLLFFGGDVLVGVKHTNTESQGCEYCENFVVKLPR